MHPIKNKLHEKISSTSQDIAGDTLNFRVDFYTPIAVKSFPPFFYRDKFQCLSLSNIFQYVKFTKVSKINILVSHLLTILIKFYF